MTCSKNLAITINEEAWPDFLYTALSANADALQSASINSYDFLSGQPVNGDSMTNMVIIAWTVKPPDVLHPGYGIVFDGSATAAAENTGNYEVTVNSSNAVIPTLSFPLTCEIFLNAVSQMVYDLFNTTGPQSVVVPIAAGDVLSFVFGVDGNLAAADSYLVTISAVKQ